MAKSKLKIQARRLRRKGKSIKKIAKILGISVSTISLWCRDIELTPYQVQRLIEYSKDGAYRGRLKSASLKRAQRIKKIQFLTEKGRRDVGALSKREFFLAGIALYWGEGFKTEESGAGLACSDPRMVQFMIVWFKEFLKCNDEDIRLRLTLNEAYRAQERRIMNFWIKETGISSSGFHKTMYITSKNRKHYEKPKAYFGTLRIVICKSRDNLRYINGWVSGLRDGNLPG